MARGPRPGDGAPDFELTGTEAAFRLSDHRGERVVLLFYPADNSAVCTRQFCSYRDSFDEFVGLGVRAVGISPQTVLSHQEFIARRGLTLPLLADPGGVVARLYGVRSRLMGTRRATFVIDEAGIVRHRHEPLAGLTYATVSDLRAALARIG